ncbi:MAG: hypothetical protein R2695_01210 [Acidimicrobiales bacterium]
MSQVIKINAITVPGSWATKSPVASQPGPVPSTAWMASRVLELLRPTDDRETWLVVTRWRDEAFTTRGADGRRSSVTATGMPGGGGGTGAFRSPPSSGATRSSSDRSGRDRHPFGRRLGVHLLERRLSGVGTGQRIAGRATGTAPDGSRWRSPR